jgi:hypothetical protein
MSLNETENVVAIIVGVSVALPVAVKAWKAAWRNFHRTMSRSDNYHTSENAYFAKRVQYALGASVVLGAFAYAVAYVGIRFTISAYVEYAQSPQTEHPAVIPPSVNVEVTTTGVANSEPRASVTPGASAESRVVSSSPDAPVVTATSPEPTTSLQKVAPEMAARDACLELRHEVEQLEKKAQYSGDDDIVRARLRLPPKPTCG